MIAAELGYSPMAKIFARRKSLASGDCPLLANANPSFAHRAKRWGEAAVHSDKKRTPRFDGCIFYGSGTRIRTQAYRVCRSGRIGFWVRIQP